MSTQTTADPQVLVPTSIERVQFHDGQLVDADALTTAMMFPVSLLQVVLRSYLGCGIVCGLEVVRPDEERPCVRIRPGVMVDCHGFPVELCREVVLDLTPDPCACETEPRTLCILMRRATSEDAAAGPAVAGAVAGAAVRAGVLRRGPRRLQPGAGPGAHQGGRPGPRWTTSATTCARRPWTTPRSDARKPGSGGSGTPVAKAVCRHARHAGADERRAPDCACLMACAERCCAERSWVLLACVTVIPAADDGCASGYTLSEVDSTRSQVRQADRVLPVAPSGDRREGEPRRPTRGRSRVEAAATKAAAVSGGHEGGS